MILMPFKLADMLLGQYNTSIPNNNTMDSVEKNVTNWNV